MERGQGVEKGPSLIPHQSWYSKEGYSKRLWGSYASAYETVEDPASKSDPVTGPAELWPLVDSICHAVALWERKRSWFWNSTKTVSLRKTHPLPRDVLVLLHIPKQQKGLCTYEGWPDTAFFFFNSLKVILRSCVYSLMGRCVCLHTGGPRFWFPYAKKKKKISKIRECAGLWLKSFVYETTWNLSVYQKGTK